MFGVERVVPPCSGVPDSSTHLLIAANLGVEGGIALAHRWRITSVEIAAVIALAMLLERREITQPPGHNAAHGADGTAR